MPDLGRGFSPAGADCGYRAPLAPRLARPSRWYRATTLWATRTKSDRGGELACAKERERHTLESTLAVALGGTTLGGNARRMAEVRTVLRGPRLLSKGPAASGNPRVRAAAGEDVPNIARKSRESGRAGGFLGRNNRRCPYVL